MGIAFKEKVERWLREIGYSVSDLTDSSVAWRLAIDHPPQTQNKMLLIGPKGGDDAVVIATGAQIAPQHLAGFERLEEGERESFLWELKRALNQLTVAYRLVGDNGSPLTGNECPKGFEVVVTRYSDGLTKDELGRSIGAVYATWLTGVMVVQEKLGGGDLGPPGRFDFRRIGLP